MKFQAQIPDDPEDLCFIRTQCGDDHLALRKRGNSGRANSTDEFGRGRFGQKTLFAAGRPIEQCPIFCHHPIEEVDAWEYPQQVVQLSTGAWYDPEDPMADKPRCVHGNPNVVTRDAGTSSLAQGCTGQLSRVEVERFDGPLPPIRAFDPPLTVD